MSEPPKLDLLNDFFAPASRLSATPVPASGEKDRGSVDNAQGIVSLPKEEWLSTPVRLALQRLLSRGVLLSRTHPEDFGLLTAGRAAIDPVMAALGLQMYVHSDYGMAVVMRTEDLDHPVTGDDAPEPEEEEDAGSSLIRTTRLNLLQSLVLMVLRVYFRERERANDSRVIIDLDTLKDRLQPYWPLLNAEARSEKRFNGAVRKMQDHLILMTVRGNEGQREISPVIVLALDSERLQAMVSEFSRLASLTPRTKDQG